MSSDRGLLGTFAALTAGVAAVGAAAKAFQLVFRSQSGREDAVSITAANTVSSEASAEQILKNATLEDAASIPNESPARVITGTIATIISFEHRCVDATGCPTCRTAQQH